MLAGDGSESPPGAPGCNSYRKNLVGVFCLKEYMAAPSEYPISSVPMSRGWNASDSTGSRRALGFLSFQRLGILKGARPCRSRSYATISPYADLSINLPSQRQELASHTILEPYQGKIQGWVGQQSSYQPWGSIRCYYSGRVKRVH